MPLETASHITDLVSTNPASGDQVAVADDHLRLIKSVLLTDFATINGPITATVAEINSLNGILKTQLDRSGSLTTTNTATAYNLATNTVFASLSAMNGKAIIFKPHVTSGASPTLNVDGLGAVALKSIAGTVIPTGALLVGGRYAVTYNDSATEFVVHGIFGVLPSTTFAGNVTVTTGGLTVTAGASTFGASVTISSGGLVVSASGAAITGNSSVTGTLGVSSDFNVNTNKFTVAAATGNTTVAGTLGVTGKATFSGLTNQSSAAYASTTAGDIEYDGKAFAMLPVASDRGIVPAVHFLSLSANQTGVDSLNAQPWFPGGGATGYTSAASTSYFFEGQLYVTRAAGATNHTTAFLFGGTATFTSINGVCTTTDAGGGGSVSPFITRFDVATATTVIAVTGLTNEQFVMNVSGIMRVNGAGTVIPQFKYSAAPGGAPTIIANSFFRMYPIGNDTVLNVGNWS